MLPPDPVKIAIVLDCWSAPRREGFIAIKAYWINNDWQSAEALIGFERIHGNHSGEALGNIVIKKLEEFKILTRIIALTSDNASNNKTLTDTLNKAIPWIYKKLNIRSGIAQVPCLAHVIQLAVQQLTSKINITAKDNAIQDEWITEKENNQLEAVRGTLKNPQYVSIW